MKKFILAALLLLSGCTDVTPLEFSTATKACEEFGGLQYYTNPVSIRDTLIGTAYCVDGTKVTPPSQYITVK